MASRRRRTRRQRLPPDQARRALLEAGRDHVYEHPLGEPLDHVRVTDIADRLGLTIGAVYHYWDTQDDYRDDLVDLLLSADALPAVHEAAASVDAALDEAPAFEELVRLSAAISFGDLAANAERERLLLAFLCHGDDEIDQRLGEQSREVSRRWADLFAHHVPAYGLEPRPPFTYESIAVVLMGLAQGLHLRRTIDPEPTTAETVPGWDLFATSALAFLTAALRPVAARTDPAGDERTLWDLARRVIPRRTPDR